MKLTYYGHSCFSVQAQGKHLLFDPFIKANPLAASIDIKAIKADYIFVTHAHYDHIDDLKDIALQTNGLVLSGWEINNWCVKQGLNNTMPINPGGQYNSGTWQAKCVSAAHSSSFADGSYGGVAAGFVIYSPEAIFYYSGDTALSFDMQLIRKWTKPDFAVLPIGDHLTMGIEDAIEAAKFVGVTKVVGVHYDTFELIQIDHEAAKAAFRAEGIELFLPAIGSTINI